MRFYPALLFAALIMAATGCHSKDSSASTSTSGQGVHTLKKLKIDDTVKGDGPVVEAGDDVWVMYKGKLTDGSVFDTNEKPDGAPFHVTVGASQVIKGWDQGLLGMKEGGTRNLGIPADLAYGKGGQEKIPAESDLYFEIEMKRVMKAADRNTITVKDTKVGSGPEAQMGSTVRIDYQLFAGNKLFEDSKKNVTQPTIFKIGDHKTQIEDFDKTIVGMKVGGSREVMIPPLFSRFLHNEKIGNDFVRAEITLVSVK